MAWLYGLLIIGLLLFTILLQKIVFLTEADEKKHRVRIRFMGITLFDSRKEKKAPPKKRKSKTPPKKPKRDSSSKERLWKLLDQVREIASIGKGIGEDFRGKIICKKFLLHLTFGMEDAADVGITTGVIWSGLGALYPLLDSYIQLQNPDIQVQPIFNQEVFHFRYEGIYQLKFIHIIYILLKNSKKLFKFMNQFRKDGVLNV